MYFKDFLNLVRLETTAKKTPTKLALAAVAQVATAVDGTLHGPTQIAKTKVNDELITKQKKLQGDGGS